MLLLKKSLFVTHDLSLSIYIPTYYNQTESKCFANIPPNLMFTNFEAL